MSSRSGKSTPAKLVDSPDDIRRRKELAERKMRERHEIIKREHSDKIRKDLEDHSRLQKELKEKEARELRRQQEIMQKNLERLNRDEERRKELLARNHAATSRTAQKNIAFGSSTPRELSYLDRLPKSQKTYDKKLSPSPARDYELKTPNKSMGSARKGLMVSSMYVPSPRSTKATTLSKPTTPKTSNSMTQSYYSARTTSSAGISRADRSTPVSKARQPRTLQAGPNASGKPPLPNNLKFPKRMQDLNTKTETVVSKSPNRKVKPSEEVPITNGKIPETRVTEEDSIVPLQTSSTRIEEQLAESFEEELKSEQIFQQNDVAHSAIPVSTEPAIHEEETLLESFEETVLPQLAPEISAVAETKIEEDAQDYHNATSLEQEFANLLVEEERKELPIQVVEKQEVEDLATVVEEESKRSDEIEKHENTIKEASDEPVAVENAVERTPVLLMELNETPSLAQELGDDMFEPLNQDIQLPEDHSNNINSETPSKVAFNLIDTDYETLDVAPPAEPISSSPSSDETNVGNSSSEELKPYVVDEHNKDLTSNLLDLEEVPKSLAEHSVLSVANQAFEIVQNTNPAEFTPINEHAIPSVGEVGNNTESANPQLVNDTVNPMNNIESESSKEEPEVLPEADQVKISSLPPSPPIQQKSRETEDNSGEEPQKKESDVRARLAAVLSKTREQGRLSPTEKVVEAAVVPPATTVKFSPSTAALLQKLKDSGRVSDKLSSLITKQGSEPTLEDNPEDPRHGRDLID